jgi:succinate-semialdehyde dehydrogenase / glutarate-semialdehyde dehydrogenase
MLTSTNPYNNQINSTHETISDNQLIEKLELAKSAQENWSKTTFNQRGQLFLQFADILKTQKEELAHLITLEMGANQDEGEAEILKTALIADIFASSSEEMLKDQVIDTNHKSSFIKFDPLGTLFHIAPWNYPFYLALRPVIPAIMAGNTVVMKHASNVPQIALKIEELFILAGFPKGVFQTLLIATSQAESVIASEVVQVVTLIGSEKVGSIVASQAGKYLKKTVLELGGNDPMLVYKDANLDQVSDGIIASRFRNAGQSCNAPKRVIIESSVEQKLIELLKQKLAEFKINPLATLKARDEVLKQITDSVELGAKIEFGGKSIESSGNFMEATILSNVKENMPVFINEVFGPVISIVSVDNPDEILRIANNSRYGLGASIWTQDIEKAKKLIPFVEAGNVYVNSVVRGNPKLPFGGIKKTGYGREFGEYGIKEFVNIKSVVIEV